MTDPDFAPGTEPSKGQETSASLPLTDSRVAILGLGLMGGSLALALRGRCRALVGVDPDPATLALARQRHMVEQASADPAEILPQANLIILAAPIRSILALIRRLPALHPGPATVLDLGSTKREIVRALAGLPPRFDPLGGHPMCGKETSGLVHADPALFQGAPFAFTPLPRTSPHARSLAAGLARAIGAHPVWLDAETHDRQVATTSHLPYLLAAALTLATPAEAASLVGPGFRGATRLAASHPGMMSDILASNRAPIQEALNHFRRQLNYLEEELAASGAASLEQLLTRVAARRRELTAQPGRPA